MGHVATIVDSFRGLLLVKPTRVWLLVTWLDGTRQGIEEDYQPWTSVAELSDDGGALGRHGEHRHPPCRRQIRTAAELQKRSRYAADPHGR